MLFRHLYDTSLSQASYLIGCQAKHEAIVVDPLRDVEHYIELAKRESVQITAVLETHIHADFCSGARELAARTGAQLFLSGTGGEEWRYRFAESDGAAELTDGASLVVGRIRLTAIHTPGHTPEHLSFLVTDGASSQQPMGLLTGDFLFVGDVGRPELLDDSGQERHAMEASARTLFRSLQRLRDLPDYLQIWPGHGAGSLSGRALGAMSHSTLGYERMVNWALHPQTEETFVRELLRGQPEMPSYFAVMKQMNRDGPRVRGAQPPVRFGSGLEVQDWLAEGGLVVDARSGDAFAHAHLRGSLNIPGNRSFSAWFGSLVNYDRDVWLLANSEAHGSRLVRELTCIGYDSVIGISAADDTLIGVDTDVVAQRSAASLAGALGRQGLTVLDVRTRGEWDAGHIAGAAHIPLSELAARFRDLPENGTVVCVCSSGGRSAIAASLLQMADLTGVENLSGGMQAWQQGGFRVLRETPPPGAPIPTTRMPTPAASREIPGFLGR
jgi:hydroxyacylglutathione hydrolase